MNIKKPPTKEERYDKLREGMIHNYSISELVAELCKREGVEEVKFISCYTHEYYLPNAKRILVVRE